MVSLRHAAIHCEFQDLDEALEQLVCRVKDLRLQHRLLASSELTLQIALDEARAAEQSDRSEIKKYQAAHGQPSSATMVNQQDVEDADEQVGDEEVSRLKLSAASCWKLPTKSSQIGCLSCGGNHMQVQDNHLQALWKDGPPCLHLPGHASHLRQTRESFLQLTD